jgi:U3 small nucleolar RNA-associated protein 19
MSGGGAALAGIKRKRESSKVERRPSKSKPRPTSSKEGYDPQTEITRLESQIVESRKHYNNIATLLQLAKDFAHEYETSILAAVALCRVFTRLLSSGDMVKSKGMAESEGLIVSWLKERYREYVSALLGQFIRSEHAPKQSVGLTLLIRLVKEESKQRDYNWKKSPLSKTVETLLLLPDGDATREEFAEKYFNIFDDIRFYTFQIIK